MNVYLFFHHTVSRRMPVQATQKRAFETELLHRLESTTSGLSMARCVPILYILIGAFTPESLVAGNVLSCSIG
jgi:hypothetical protein